MLVLAFKVLFLSSTFQCIIFNSAEIYPLPKPSWLSQNPNAYLNQRRLMQSFLKTHRPAGRTTRFYDDPFKALYLDEPLNGARNVKPSGIDLKDRISQAGGYKLILSLLVLLLVGGYAYFKLKMWTARQRRNLLKMSVFILTNELKSEIELRQHFLKNFLVLLKKDLIVISEFLYSDSLNHKAIKYLGEFRDKVDFAQFVNDGFPVGCDGVVNCSISDSVSFALNSLVSLYHDYLGLIYLSPSKDHYTIELPSGLMHVVVMKLLLDAFDYPSVSDKVSINISVSNMELSIIASVDVDSIPVIPLNRTLLRNIFGPELRTYFFDVSTRHGVFFEEVEVGAGYKIRAVFDSMICPLTNKTVDDVDCVERSNIGHYLNSLKDCTLMVVEDNDIMRQLICDCLSRYLNVVSLSSAEQAFGKLEEIVPDALLIDSSLSGINGLDFAKWFRLQNRFSDIPLFILSGSDLSNELENKASNLCNQVVVKPIDFEIFLPNLCFEIAKSKGLEVVCPIKRCADKNDLIFSEQYSYKKDLPKSENNEAILVGDSYFANSDFVAKLFEAIEEIVPHPDKTIDDLASRFYTSPRNFRRKVSAVVKMSPKELLKLRRLQYAAELLKNTNLPVTEVSYKSGYASQSNFNRQFKTVFRYAPLEYRKIHRN